LLERFHPSNVGHSNMYVWSTLLVSPTGLQPKSQTLRAVSIDLEQDLFAARQLTQNLAAPLSDEDQTVQSCPDASPTKWHLAHTSWFFETFVLSPHLPGYEVFDPRYNFCFNSYYETQGARQPRADRGLLTRPSSAEVRSYRAHVDHALEQFFTCGKAHEPHIAPLLEIGLNHEQQHQELLLTDILHLFANNPLRPAYREQAPNDITQTARPLRWIDFSAGLYTIGHAQHSFAYDNEMPSHRVFANPFRLADRLVTNGEWLAFMKDGGYQRHHLWLSDGWAKVQSDAWQAPLYWEEKDGAWFQMTLFGLRPVDPAAPVSHVSYYEADAFARWAGKRLPTEFEWEIASSGVPVAGNMLSSGALRPLRAAEASDINVSQMFGDVWEWTQSAYAPYPGYRPAQNALGEYNGKFMCSQQVLRGASCVTPDSHARNTYRNFFYPHQRWQFCGLRLADEA
jgi:ergothioneine biosynthesis protein EgtB